jgi:hypothetical protein
VLAAQSLELFRVRNLQALGLQLSCSLQARHRLLVVEPKFAKGMLKASK